MSSTHARLTRVLGLGGVEPGEIAIAILAGGAGVEALAAIDAEDEGAGSSLTIAYARG